MTMLDDRDQLLLAALRDVTVKKAEIERLRAALAAADHYIARLEAVQRRQVVRDMTEAMEGYRTAHRAVEQKVATASEK